MQTTDQNKATVLRFNKECIEQGNLHSFEKLIAADAINHVAPPGTPNGPAGFMHFLNDILRKAFPDLKVEVLDQLAEGDKVTTRKVIRATHTGELMGMAPTKKSVTIHVIDIVRLRDNQYVEHWAASNFNDVVRELSAGN